MLAAPAALLPASPASLTESQIITTLNSSIEDLLSKISQLQQDCQASAPVLRPLSYLPLQNNHMAQGEAALKTAVSFGEPSTPNSATEICLQDEEAAKENCGNPQKQDFSRLDTAHSISSCATPPALESTSLGNIEQNSDQHFYIPQNHKIHSLFDNPSVKQLASSQIFPNQQPDDHVPNHLYAREVSQATVSLADSSFNLPTQRELTLAEFQIGASVGSGKFGEVYLCRHRLTGLLFALKKICKSTILEYKMEGQFCQQIKLMYLLDHPNIVKLYAHFSDDYHVFLLMEFVEGGQLLGKLGCEERDVARLMEPLMAAVEYLHSKDIVHRDIKPENIVVAFDHTPKLCDFGWAAVCSRDSMRQTFCGTLDYLSPEMKDGVAYSCRVDLWSLGVLVFELITGSAPFRLQLAEWRRKGMRSDRWDWQISYPPSVSALARNFMGNLLKENPDERSSISICRSHFFIGKYRPRPKELNIELQL